ncbi:hypothetical protein E2562_025871 [Oryza meyeriana var. granulata]|uniref:Uncharacterized protein n=1 Tax=Oryza meyeriana var. granulata TaxID=110450 RepID=A0A6G1D800_9ORYZ|nr:hypothetical protein E2562_025871 [Oryza meyeriana var. granulata]
MPSNPHRRRSFAMETGSLLHHGGQEGEGECVEAASAALALTGAFPGVLVGEWEWALGGSADAGRGGKQHYAPKKKGIVLKPKSQKGSVQRRPKKKVEA